jgi:hypothetical protein
MAEDAVQGHTKISEDHTLHNVSLEGAALGHEETSTVTTRSLSAAAFCPWLNMGLHQHLPVFTV